MAVKPITSWAVIVTVAGETWVFLFTDTERPHLGLVWGSIKPRQAITDGSEASGANWDV